MIVYHAPYVILILRIFCADINECTVDNGGCTEVCENTDGSFFCACDGDEKALSSDGKSCVGEFLIL